MEPAEHPRETAEYLPAKLNGQYLGGLRLYSLTQEAIELMQIEMRKLFQRPND